MYSIANEIRACQDEDWPQSYFVKTLPFLRDALVSYVNERPHHYGGLCAWVSRRAERLDHMVNEQPVDYYVVIDILRRQRDLDEAYGSASYVDEEDGPTELRVEFARMMLVLVLERLVRVQRDSMWKRED